jgi:hypothetical protein
MCNGLHDGRVIFIEISQDRCAEWHRAVALVWAKMTGDQWAHMLRGSRGNRGMRSCHQMMENSFP